MEFNLKTLGWIFLVFGLCILTFGFLPLLTIALCISISSITIYLATFDRINMHLKEAVGSIRLSDENSTQNDAVLKGKAQIFSDDGCVKLDSRITGSSLIDEQLNEVIRYILRDYIYDWHGEISLNDDFPQSLRTLGQQAAITLCSKMKEVEWVPYLTTRLVDDFTNHVRLYRKTQDKLSGVSKDEKRENATRVFFDLEMDLYGSEYNRCNVSQNEECLATYLRNVCAVCLYFLLPPDDFNNKLGRDLVVGLIVNKVLLPLIDLLADPDYINQIIIWLCRDVPKTSETFLTVIRSIEKVEELVAVRDKIHQEIAIQRGKDSGGDDDSEIKSQLNSLFFVKKIVDNRIKRLQEGDETNYRGKTDIDWNKMLSSNKVFALKFEDIMNNNVALHYFIDFLSLAGNQNYVLFYFAIDGFRVSAEQQLADLSSQSANENERREVLDTLREFAIGLFMQYLSDKANPKLRLNDDIVKRLYLRISTDNSAVDWFDDIQNELFEVLQSEQFYRSFRRTKQYLKLLSELDLLREGSRSEETDSLSLDFNLDSLSMISSDDCTSTSGDRFEPGLTSNTPCCCDTLNSETMLIIRIIYSIIVKEGKGYASYVVEVTRKDKKRTEHGEALPEVKKWQVQRRYSDFHDFQLMLVNRFGCKVGANFPGKRAFNNMTKTFLDRRQQQLQEYIQELLSEQTAREYPGVKAMLHHFLEQSSLRHHQSESAFSKKLELVKHNPVTNMVKSMPGTLFNTVDGLGRALQGKMQSKQLSTTLINLDGDDNIPLRIMLLLVDEVFNLKSRNQWFRRRIVDLMRQIIKATYGDKLNRRIINFVEDMTSANQVAEHIKLIKNSIWPNGNSATTMPIRDDSIKLRTMVAAKLSVLDSIPDDLKHVIGSDTTRKGAQLVLDMFQNRALNVRLVIMILEGLLDTVLPEHKFNELCKALHSKT